MLNSFSVLRQISRSLVVPAVEQPLHVNGRRQNRFAELQEHEHAITCRIGAGLEGNYLDCRLTSVYDFYDSGKLGSHDRRATDLAMKHGLVKQHTIAGGILSLQQLLATNTHLYTS